MGSLDKLLTNLLIKLLGPLLAKTGTKWKTSWGLLILLFASVCQTLLSDLDLSEDVVGLLRVVFGAIQAATFALTNLGVIHKFYQAEPPIDPKNP